MTNASPGTKKGTRRLAAPPTRAERQLLVLQGGYVYSDDDYTFHVVAGEKFDPGPDARTIEAALKNEPDEVYSGTLELRDGKDAFECRALICRCSRRQEFSITVRSPRLIQTGEPPKIDKYPDPILSPASPYRARDGCKSQFHFSLANLCNALYEVIPREKPNAEGKCRLKPGLVVVTGTTNSAKSVIARGLIHKHLEGAIAEYDRLAANDFAPRRPHLVTFEDPIETYYAIGPKGDANAPPSQLAQSLGIDYTPRERGIDVQSLDIACRDALRQTPAVFYVGEVRDRDEWENVLNFAGTGHLVVTTAHAGSLVEAMERILMAVRARSAGERGHFAQRILAVIHLAAFSVGEKLAHVPSIWRRTPSGVAALVADGLASVLPHNPGKVFPDTCPSLGRRWFAHQLRGEMSEKLIEELEVTATRLDIQGG